MLSKRGIIIRALVVGVLVVLLFSLGLLTFSITRGSNDHPFPHTNVISNENTHQGTSSWEIPSNKRATIEIQAYASATSVLPGELLNFYVSTQREGTHYSINIYRNGLY